MKKKILLILLIYSSIITANVKNTPIQRTDVGDVTVISEMISEDKWRVTLTNHSQKYFRCAKVEWNLDGFYWHPICSKDKTYSKKLYKGHDQKTYWKTEKICVSGKRHVTTNKVNIIGYLKKINVEKKAKARIKMISAARCK